VLAYAGDLADARQIPDIAVQLAKEERLDTLRELMALAVREDLRDPTRAGDAGYLSGLLFAYLTDPQRLAAEETIALFHEAFRVAEEELSRPWAPPLTAATIRRAYHYLFSTAVQNARWDWHDAGEREAAARMKKEIYPLLYERFSPES